MQTNYTITRLKHSELKPAPFNRASIDGHTRSGFDSKSLGELAESIRIQGIVQPLIVRKPHGAKQYEIVAGERRWTAAGIVNKKFDVPCIVRQLTDAEAREINAIENLQRVGLHPIEEARGYQDLLDLDINPRYTIEKIAEKVSKSAAFVYARIKLLRAPELAQKASFRGKLTHSNLLLIARIPDPKLAHQATVEILDPIGQREEVALDPHYEPMSYRTAKRHIQDKYMIRIKDAPFNTEDADLVPSQWIVRYADGRTETVHQLPKPEIGMTYEQGCGGKCSDCPFLTGNMKALFADVESADVCTHTPCYKKKVAADFKRRSELAKADGHTVMKDSKAEKLFYEGKLSTHNQDFVDIDAPCPTDKKGRAWNDVLGEHVPDKLVQARDDKGKVHFLLPMAEVIEAAQKAKVKLPETRAQQEATNAEDRAKQKAERERTIQINRSVEAECLTQMRAKVAKMKPTADFWRGILFEILGRSELLERYDIKDDKVLTAFLKKKDEGELRALLVESQFFYHNLDWNGEFSESFTQGCKEFDVDYKAIHKRIVKAADARPKEFQKALDTVSPEAK